MTQMQHHDRLYTFQKVNHYEYYTNIDVSKAENEEKKQKKNKNKILSPKSDEI